MTIWDRCPRGLDQTEHEENYKHGYTIRRDDRGGATDLDLACVCSEVIDHAGNMYRFMAATGWVSTEEQIKLDALVRAKESL